ncbi:MAG: type VI secretion system tube protein Hcp [Terriglobales bacterium]
MASDYYLQIDSITGESAAEGMTGQIDVDSWSFGASNPSSIGGQGLAAGKPSCSDFSFGGSLEKSSFAMFSNLFKGAHLKSAKFTGRKTGGGGTPYVYVVTTMTNVLITSYQLSGAAQADGANVSGSLAFEKIEYQYYTQDTATGGTKLAGAASYDLKLLKVA